MTCTRVSPRARPGRAGPGGAEAGRADVARPPPPCLSAGDPKQDLAYERQYEQQTYQVIPEVIKNFIQYFHKTVSDLIDQKVYELQASRVSSDLIDQKVYEIQDIYENRCPGLGWAVLLGNAPPSHPHTQGPPVLLQAVLRSSPDPNQGLVSNSGSQPGRHSLLGH